MRSLGGFEENNSIRMCSEESLSYRVECDRCGKCCEAFILPWNEGQIVANAEAARKGSHQYQYINEYGRTLEETVNAMMAVWAPYLEKIEIPKVYMAEIFLTREKEVTRLTQDGYVYNQNWYRCLHHKKKDGVSFCSVHKSRPKVCQDFQLSIQGGYLRDPLQIVYKDCSYRKFLERNKEATSLRKAEFSK